MKRLGAVLIAVCMLLTCVTAVFGADAAEVSAALNFRDFSVEIQGVRPGASGPDQYRGGAGERKPISGGRVRRGRLYWTGRGGC